MGHPLFNTIRAKIMEESDLPTVATFDLYNRFGVQEDLAALYFRTCPHALQSSGRTGQSTNSHAQPEPTKRLGVEEWELPDFTLKAEDVGYSCHKWLLSGRWPFFRDALAFGGSEERTSTLELPSDTFSPELLRSFIHYLYTHEVEPFEDLEQALDMLLLASQFRLTNLDGTISAGFELLLSQCSRTLSNSLTVDNCIQVYKKLLDGETSQHEHNDSLMLARNFITSNMNTLTSSPQYAQQLESLGTKELVRFLHEVRPYH